jgi:hypothetical protein
MADGRRSGSLGPAAGREWALRLQQSTESFNTHDLAVVSFMLGLDDPVEALVYALVVVVLEILGKDIAQLLLRRYTMSAQPRDHAWQDVWELLRRSPLNQRERAVSSCPQPSRCDQSIDSTV